MSKGYLIFAQNSSVDYVRQAVALSASLKSAGNVEPVSLVTNDPVPENFKNLFDKIIPIPWGDLSESKNWKIENRWKLYHVSPYNETIVMDSDILVTEDLTTLWNFLENFDLYFTSTVYDFTSKVIKDEVNRKVFVQNDLPNLYSGLHFFRKSQSADDFYQLLELIVKNYQDFYNQYTPNATQKFLSIDVAAAIACKILDNKHLITCDAYQPINFYHLKTNLQSLPVNANSWVDVLDCEYSSKLIIGNRQLRGVIHYVEDKFLTDEIFNKVVVNV